MNSDYRLPYTVAIIVGVIGVIATVLGAYWHYVDVPPSWLTPDVVRTCALIAVICGILSPALPSVFRTPAKREASHLSSLAGVLPKDLAAKYPSVLVKGPVTEPVEPPVE